MAIDTNLPDVAAPDTTGLDPFDGILPVEMDDADYKDTLIEIDDDLDASEDGLDASGDGSADPIDDDGGFVDPSEDASQKPVSRETQSEDAFDPNTAEMRQERVREREAQQRLEQEYETASQLMKAETEKFDAERSRSDAYLANVETQLQQYQQALVQAIDDEDTASQIQLQGDIQKLNQARGEITQYQSNIPTADQVTQRWNDHWQQKQHQISAQFASHVPKPQNETARAWQSKNGWMRNPDNKGAVQDLIGINNQLVSEGYDANANSFYQEMGRRLASQHPNLPLKDHHGRNLTRAGARNRGQAGPPVASARSPTAPARNGLRRSSNGKTVVTLDASDKALIRAFNRDPSDKEFAREYAREKAQRLTREAASARR